MPLTLVKLKDLEMGHALLKESDTPPPPSAVPCERDNQIYKVLHQRCHSFCSNLSCTLLFTCIRVFLFKYVNHNTHTHTKSWWTSCSYICIDIALVSCAVDYCIISHVTCIKESICYTKLPVLVFFSHFTLLTKTFGIKPWAQTHAPRTPS